MANYNKRNEENYRKEDMPVQNPQPRGMKPEQKEEEINRSNKGQQERKPAKS